MNCPKCGSPLTGLDFACPNCGNPINSTPTNTTNINSSQTGVTPLNNNPNPQSVNNTITTTNNINTTQNIIPPTNNINNNTSINNYQNSQAPINNVENITQPKPKNNGIKIFILLLLLVVIVVGFIFKDKLFKNGVNIGGKELLYDTIIKTSLGSEKDNNIKLGSNEKEEKSGLYVIDSTKNDKYPIYFFRGEDYETNNFIIFANFCWRIVRTTETGGIKIIYTGIPKDNKCYGEEGAHNNIGESTFNDTMNDNTFVGYKYGNTKQNDYNNTHTNTNDSTIKVFIEKWFEDNLVNYQKYIEDTVWCNDRQVKSNGYATLETSYRGNDLVHNNLEPSLKCTDNDSFKVNSNNKLKYPIGLITADEAIYAGATIKSIMPAYISYITISDMYGHWSMTPFYYNYGTYSYMTHISTSIEHNVVNKPARVNPMISLNNNVVVKSGDGSSSNPYIIKTN